MGDAEQKRAPIEVGAGATIFYHSDREPATVVWIAPDESMIVVQEDHAKRLDALGMSDVQDYEYSRNPEGKIHVFQWKTIRGTAEGWGWVPYGNPGGRKPRDHGTILRVGERRKYFDYTY